jgi:hypothetical protein
LLLQVSMRTPVREFIVLVALAGVALLFPTCSTITTCRCCLWTAHQACDRRPVLDPQGWYAYAARGDMFIGNARRGSQARDAWEMENVGALRLRFGLFLRGITLDVIRARPEWHMVVEFYTWLNLVPAVAAWLVWLLWSASRRRVAAAGQRTDNHLASEDTVERAGMTRRHRLGVMVLAPPVIGGSMLLLWMPFFFSTQGRIPFLEVVPVAFLLAFVLAVPPSIVFAAIMEFAFAKGLDARRWPALLLATGFETMAGVGLGAFIARAFRASQTGGIRAFLVVAGSTAGLAVALAIRAGSPPSTPEGRR